MIQIKSQREIELMRCAGRIAANALAAAGRAVASGITTGELNDLIMQSIEKDGAYPSFLGYAGFPGAACISINDEVIHGIPGARKLCEGDLVKIDVGATYRGYIGDCANTFAVGKISDEAQRLIDVTRQSFYEGIKYALTGNRISDISHAIQTYVEDNGFSVVRKYIGHGVGAKLHEEPEVPNFGKPGCGARIVSGMTIAIEPMVNQGVYTVKEMSDGWTVKTRDGKLSAHYENSVLITEDGPEILTLADENR
ncbi:MAG: type I methionyl aminopeptidase [Oscillospiraceae bacterium]|nr:type I methionyl aminopeptidase [Oscillospiraceae bacterium]